MNLQLEKLKNIKKENKQKNKDYKNMRKKGTKMENIIELLMQLQENGKMTFKFLHQEVHNSIKKDIII